MSSRDPVQTILSRLQAFKLTGRNQWQARCPAHEDRVASLSIGRGEAGRALVHCHAGCTTTAILAAIDLGESDLFVEQGQACPPAQPSRKLSTVFPTAEAATEALGQRVEGSLAGSWCYQGLDGQEVFRVLRFATGENSKTYRPIHRHNDRWVLGDPPGLLPLYRLPELQAAGRVYLCEGEKCVDAARAIGLVATTSAHGAESADKSDWGPLAGKDVVIFPDNDDAGRQYAQKVSDHLGRLKPPARVRIIQLPGLPPHGDIADFLEASDSKTSEELKGWIESLVQQSPDETPMIVPVRRLLGNHPCLRPPVIYSLLREGETMNLVAPPKTGKSWLAVDLAIAVASGQQWLGQFRTVQGDVLVIDNELHEETIAHRIPKVGLARNLGAEAYADHVCVTSLRGRLKSIPAMGGFFEAIEPGRFKVIIIDALYRVLPSEIDENSNAEMAQVYNTIDRYADRLRCCFVLIHHSSKGNQSQKNVTDIGAGAGSQSRAADAHVVLRQHEENGVVVFEAAVRSWPPVEPTCLRWNFPVWQPAPDLDPTALRSERPRRKPPSSDSPPPPPEPAWDAQRFAETFLTDTPRLKAGILSLAGDAGLSDRQANRHLASAEVKGLAFRWKLPQAWRETHYANCPQPVLPMEDPS